MNAEILSVGTELLMGQIANTNAQYLSKKLSEAGINVYFHTVVGDNPIRLEKCLNLSISRSDCILMTGGLGPTRDDLTKEIVAKVSGKNLIFSKKIYGKINKFFKKMGRPMVESNKRQAFMPEGSIVTENNVGTAPGGIVEFGQKVIVMLPGPPSELIPMFEKYVLPYFLERAQSKIVSKFIKVFGLGESDVEQRIMDLIDCQSNPTIAPYAKQGEVTLRVSANAESNQDVNSIINPVVQKIKERLDSHVYSVEDEELYEVVGKLLIKKNISISIAESCTGGLISKMITDIPGISKVFKGCSIVYSNESKIENLGIKKETIDKHGAVSREVAIEMAESVKRLYNTNIGISSTGIAGPGGGTASKPVGLVYIAISDNEKTVTKELRLTGDRKRIRNMASLYSFDMIRRKLLGLPINNMEE